MNVEDILDRIAAGVDPERFVSEWDYHHADREQDLYETSLAYILETEGENR